MIYPDLANTNGKGNEICWYKILITWFQLITN